MRNNLLLAAIAVSVSASAQYGTFDKKALEAAKSSTTIVQEAQGEDRRQAGSRQNGEVIRSEKAGEGDQAVIWRDSRLPQIFMLAGAPV